MQPGKGVIAALVLIVTTFSVESAFPNGINPPRPGGGSVVTTMCKERSSSRDLEIYRTKIKYGKRTAKGIRFRVGDTVQLLPLSEVQSIELSGKSADAGGFTKATLVRIDDSEKESVLLEVKRGGKALRLVGFTKGGKAMSVSFAGCKTIRFASGTTGAEEEGSEQPERPPRAD